MKNIPWWQPQFGEMERHLIGDVLSNAFPNEGVLTGIFEKKIAKLLGVRHVLAVTSATAGMFLSLKAAGITQGDEVIVPDISFIATANAVEMTGAKAILADVDPKTLTIDTKKIERSITKRTRAIIPVHVSGRGADMKTIITLARKHELFVIEDAAEAFMSKHEKIYLGTYGNTGCFSLSPAKTITTGQGGLIVTSSDSLYLKLKMLKDQGRPVRGTGGDDIHPGLGFNFKFTDLQAAVGIGQLSYLKKRITRMKKNYRLYKTGLENIPGFSLLPFQIDNGELPQWTDALADRRDELDSYLKSKNIHCRRYWHPIHTQAYYKQSNTKFPVSTNSSPQAIWLPSSFTLTDKDVEDVCKAIRRFYSNEKKN
ncbi:MAG: DegT/DnrJ/EryC1/StrS family aminotransferase [bacterium]|nr:DegT/DnrJ/EryC1/StrS family aminotransferase [bacterium]